MKIFELIPTNGRKSFYGKAKAIETDDGEKILLSYDTQVLKIDNNGDIFRLWTGETKTTINHANAFLKLYGVNGAGLAFWRTIPTAQGVK